MKVKQISVLTLLVALFMSYYFSYLSVHGQASNNDDFTIPDTEVKFLINPDLVLDGAGNLLAEIADLFGGFERDRGRTVTMQFMDTPDQVFNSDGWFNRIRYRDWNQPSEGYQITYRRRIPIEPVNEQTIRLAVEQAYTDGFVGWDMNLDWSYDAAALTLSYSAQTGEPASSVLPDDEMARELLQEHMPEQMAQHFNRELLDAFDHVVAHGPVTFRRYEFDFPGTDERILRIEVLPITSTTGVVDHIVEVSFEFENEGNFEVISQRRAEMQMLLDGAGILLPESGLRTTLVLDQYRHHEMDRTLLVVGSVLLVSTLLVLTTVIRKGKK